MSKGEPKKNKFYFDGGCKPNPGIMEVGLVMIDEKGKKTKIHRKHKYGTNNEAEWISFLLGLTIAHKKGVKDIEILGDSSIVVNQATGKWKCKAENLRKYLERYQAMKENFDSISIKYIPRAKNLAGILIEEENGQ